MSFKSMKINSDFSFKLLFLVDAENNPESRKLANVSNLPTFATFVNGKLVNETQTNKQEVLADLVNEIA